MSAVTLMSEGFTTLLDAMLDELVLDLHLYTNDPDLEDDLTAEDFEEAEYDTYAPQTIKRWSPSAMDRNQAWSSADPLTFACSGEDAPEPIQGYYVTTGPDEVLLWAWRRPGEAYPLSPGGPPLQIFVEARFPPEIPTPV